MNDSQLGNLISNSKQISSFHVFKDNEYGISDLCQNKIKNSEVTTVSFDNTIKIYDINKLTMIKNLKKHTKGVWTIDYSQDSNHFLTGGNDNKIFLWDSNNFEVISELGYHDEVIYDVKFSTNGKYFASVSKGLTCVWDLNNLKEPISVIKDQHKEFIYSVNFIDNDKYLVTGFMDGYILIVDINDLSKNQRILVPKTSHSFYSREETKQEGNSSSSKLNDNQVLTGHEDGAVYSWKIDNGDFKETSKYCYFNQPVTSINSSFDDQYLVASCKDHSTIVWNTGVTNKMEYFLVGHSDVVTCSDFISKDMIATCSYDTTFRLWKLN